MRCGFTLADVPARLPWRALLAFAGHIDERSATFRELHPEYGGWTVPEALMADVFDAVMEVARTVAALSGKKPKKIPPHTRPWAKDRHTRHFGRGAIPVSKFNEFWEGDA